MREDNRASDIGYGQSKLLRTEEDRSKQRSLVAATRYRFYKNKTMMVMEITIVTKY